MIYISTYSRKDWEQKFPSLKFHPTICPDCKQTKWDDGIFYPWISKDYAGYTRVCSYCDKQQNTVMLLNKEKEINFHNFCEIILKGEKC